MKQRCDVCHPGKTKMGGVQPQFCESCARLNKLGFVAVIEGVSVDDDGVVTKTGRFMHVDKESWIDNFDAEQPPLGVAVATGPMFTMMLTKEAMSHEQH